MSRSTEHAFNLATTHMFALNVPLTFGRKLASHVIAETNYKNPGEDNKLHSIMLAAANWEIQQIIIDNR